MKYPNLKQFLLPVLALCSIGVLSLVTAPQLQGRELIKLYELAHVPESTQLDQHVEAVLRQQGLSLAPLCKDGVYIRRVYLSLTGTLPLPKVAMDFIKSKDPNKRDKLVGTLLQSENYALYQSLRWGDSLRIKSEFPINLWPNAVQAYSQWVLDALRENMPYDQFARALLTASGSNFRNPPVNFYRAVQGKDAESLAGAVALTFMGTRLEKWPPVERLALESFFEDVAFKPTSEWKEEIVHRDPSVYAAAELTLPDGQAVQVPAGADKRMAFTNWLITPDNDWFVKAAVNRQWAWLMGRGIIDEPDDIRADNPPVNPELLDYLCAVFVQSGYDLRALQRTIINSRTYQQSFIPQSGEQSVAEKYFACYPLRRMDAEVLADALCEFTKTTESYMSMVPEPFTHIPASQRSIALSDGTIASSFLELFGRPGRDTGLFAERENDATKKQCLHLLNSSHILGKISKSGRPRNFFKGKPEEVVKRVRWTYLTLYSRFPTEQELKIIQKYVKSTAESREKGGEDFIWALINSKEFLYNH